ncbi:uncharacterized protein METZ01_LOCUS236096 [marine metagenome]|uniref:Uncharacterized protein n=1 Tax=marine metagenome TaxID=408172 RepID=A0A382H7Q6_9ZZZZ
MIPGFGGASSRAPGSFASWAAPARGYCPLSETLSRDVFLIRQPTI